MFEDEFYEVSSWFTLARCHANSESSVTAIICCLKIETPAAFAMTVVRLRRARMDAC